MSFDYTTEDDLRSFSESDPYNILKGLYELSMDDIEELEVEILKVLSFRIVKTISFSSPVLMIISCRDIFATVDRPVSYNHLERLP